MIHFFTLTIIINYYFYGLQLTIVRFKNIYTKTKLQSFIIKFVIFSYLSNKLKIKIYKAYICKLN